MSKEVAIIVIVVAAMAVVFGIVCLAALQERADMKRRMKLAKERRDYNETLAANLRLELTARENAREVVVAQTRATLQGQSLCKVHGQRCGDQGSSLDRHQAQTLLETTEFKEVMLTHPQVANVCLQCRPIQTW